MQQLTHTNMKLLVDGTPPREAGVQSMACVVMYIHPANQAAELKLFLFLALYLLNHLQQV